MCCIHSTISFFIQCVFIPFGHKNSNMRIINNEQNQHYYTDFSVLLVIVIAHSFLYCYSWSIFSIYLFSQTYFIHKKKILLFSVTIIAFVFFYQTIRFFTPFIFVSILEMPKKVYKSKYVFTVNIVVIHILILNCHCYGF